MIKLHPKILNAFVPLTIAGCVLWLDGSDFDTLITDSSNNVSAWYDKSGCGNNAMQSTSSTQPVLTSLVNSTENNTVYFDGAKYLTAADNATLDLSTGDFSLIIAHMPAVLDTSGIYTLLDKGNGNSTVDYVLRFANQKANVLTGNSSTNNTSSTKTTYRLNMQTHFVVSDLSNTTLYFYDEDNDGGSTTIVSGNVNTELLTIGARGNGTHGYVGYVAEVIAYQKALSSDERSVLYDYLSTKWTDSDVPSLMKNDGAYILINDGIGRLMVNS